LKIVWNRKNNDEPSSCTKMKRSLRRTLVRLTIHQQVDAQENIPFKK